MTKRANERKKPVVVGRVKELRLRESLTQPAFAASIDVSSNTISRIEREEMSLSSDIALKIVDVYKVSLDWLFLCSDDELSPTRKNSLGEAFNCIQELNNIEKTQLKINRVKETPISTE